jgi:ABC-type dipeptide/oligopeptide/nickel transport system permease subunit
MVPRERERYHQLHPAKLLTDWGTAILAGAMLWKQRWLPAFAIGFVTSIVVTLVFVSGRLDEALERIRRQPAKRK